MQREKQFNIKKKRRQYAEEIKFTEDIFTHDFLSLKI